MRWSRGTLIIDGLDWSEKMIMRDKRSYTTNSVSVLHAVVLTATPCGKFSEKMGW